MESHNAENALSDDEKALQQRYPNDSIYVPYGTTLLAAVITDSFWFAIQLGDGMLVAVQADGTYIWPMPESSVNEGNITASLCMKDPMSDFRHVIGEQLPIGLILCTDDIEKAFSVQGESVIRYMRRLMEAAHLPEEKAVACLTDAAIYVATQSYIRDDVAFSIAVNQSVPLPVPDLSFQQKESQYRRKLAQAEELQTTIDYTLQRISESSDEAELSQLKSIAAEKLKEFDALKADLSPEDQALFKALRDIEELSAVLQISTEQPSAH